VHAQQPFSQAVDIAETRGFTKRTTSNHPGAYTTEQLH
jgi:hypothetical protein